MKLYVYQFRSMRPIRPTNDLYGRMYKPILTITTILWAVHVPNTQIRIRTHTLAYSTHAREAWTQYVGRFVGATVWECLCLCMCYVYVAVDRRYIFIYSLLLTAATATVPFHAARHYTSLPSSLSPSSPCRMVRACVCVRCSLRNEYGCI